jgi:hypothetical protein
VEYNDLNDIIYDKDLTLEIAIPTVLERTTIP